MTVLLFWGKIMLKCQVVTEKKYQIIRQEITQKGEEKFGRKYKVTSGRIYKATEERRISPEADHDHRTCDFYYVLLLYSVFLYNLSLQWIY